MFGMSADEFIRCQREMFHDKKFAAALEAALLNQMKQPLEAAEVALMIWALISVVMILAATLVVVTILATLEEVKTPEPAAEPLEMKVKQHYWLNRPLSETMMRSHEVNTK